WCDYSTLDLLSAVAQRREAARLLLIGTYRPAEIIVSGHPLKAVKQELHLHGQCEELPLGFLTADEVTHYLAARFPHHQFPTALGRILHHRTDGNPLFLVNVVDSLVSRQLVSEQEGQWRLQAPLEDVTIGVPASVRQMIEKQLERLAVEEQRVLEVASV